MVKKRGINGSVKTGLADAKKMDLEGNIIGRLLSGITGHLQPNLVDLARFVEF